MVKLSHLRYSAVPANYAWSDNTHHVKNREESKQSVALDWGGTIPLRSSFSR